MPVQPTAPDTRVSGLEAELTRLRSERDELKARLREAREAIAEREQRLMAAEAAAIAAADAAHLAEALATRQSAVVSVDGTDVEVHPDEVVVSERPREGWSVVNEQGETVALDLELTPALRRAGLAREVVRLVQEARKGAGFDVSDRIALVWRAGGEVAEALRENAALVAAEVLATELREGAPEGGTVVEADDLGLGFSVSRV
jgi:isoleucyl-tRNA synthetase